MRAWLGRGAAAAQVAADRADLWPAGALAWLTFAGWLPLLLVVARPDPDDLAFVGVSIYTSGSFPANLVTLSAGVVAAFALLCLIAGAAEVALLRSADPDRPASPFGRASLTAFTIILVASLPAVAGCAALLMGVISVAPTEFQSSEIDTPVLLRLAMDLWPLIVLALLALVASQAFGGIALRRAEADDDIPLPSVLGGAIREIAARPLGRLGVAAAALLLDVAVLLLSVALLRVLWAPIGSSLDAGQLAQPETILLLLGFVAIWLGLLLASGALHVAVSAWWALELGRGGRRPTTAAPTSVPDGRERGSPISTDTGGVR
jgi:hypothetical protein